MEALKGQHLAKISKFCVPNFLATLPNAAKYIG